MIPVDARQGPTQDGAPIPPGLLTINETVTRLNISRRMVQTLLATGELPCVHFGRAVRIDPADVDALVKARKDAAGRPPRARRSSKH